MNYVFPFEKLDIYYVSVDFVTDIYKATADFPKDENFGIISQLRRASVSIASNIAEGLGRTSRKEQARFMEIAYSSLLEVLCQMEVSKELRFLSEEEFDLLRIEAIRISSMLIKLKKAFLKQVR